MLLNPYRDEQSTSYYVCWYVGYIPTIFDTSSDLTGNELLLYSPHQLSLCLGLKPPPSQKWWLNVIARVWGIAIIRGPKSPAAMAILLSICPGVCNSKAHHSPPPTSSSSPFKNSRNHGQIIHVQICGTLCYWISVPPRTCWVTINCSLEPRAAISHCDTSIIPSEKVIDSKIANCESISSSDLFFIG